MVRGALHQLGWGPLTEKIGEDMQSRLLNRYTSATRAPGCDSRAPATPACLPPSSALWRQATCVGGAPCMPHGLSEVARFAGLAADVCQGSCSLPARLTSSIACCAVLQMCGPLSSLPSGRGADESCSYLKIVIGHGKPDHRGRLRACYIPSMFHRNVYRDRLRPSHGKHAPGCSSCCRA